MRPVSVILSSILMLLIYSPSLHAQKIFDLTVLCDSTINPKELHFSYYNGNDEVFVPDTLSMNKIVLTDQFVSKFVSVDVRYIHNNEDLGSYVFFINEKKSAIRLSISSEGLEQQLKYRNLVNAVSVLDTSSNALYKNLFLHRYKVGAAIGDLWTKFGNEVLHNDSLFLVYKNLQKKLNDCTLSFLKRYPNSYFAFWYFRDQVIMPALDFFKSDKEYLKSLKEAFRAMFSPQMVKGEECKNLIAKIDNALSPPLQQGMLAPAFKLKDVNGNIVALSDFKNRYILIDFWASWCPPCRKNNPLLREMYNGYKGRNFEIVSISADNNLDDWKAAIVKDQLTWTNLSDFKMGNNGAIFNFNVSAYPHYFLIGPDGKVLVNAESQLRKINIKLGEIFKGNQVAFKQ